MTTFLERTFGRQPKIADGVKGEARVLHSAMWHGAERGVWLRGAWGLLLGVLVLVGLGAIPVASASGASAGQLYAFGANDYGQLGNATDIGPKNPNPTPALVSLPGATGPVVQVAAGADHSLVVTSSGQLYAFGENDYGQLGGATNSGTSNPNSTPVLVSLPGSTGPVVQASAGASHSLAVTSSGQLYAFGENDYGELGRATNSGTSNPNSTPALVSLPGATGPVVQASAGFDFSLAVTSSGQLYSFGENYRGQLGRATNSGTFNPNSTPALVSLPGATGPVVQASAGFDFSLAVTSSGQLYAFGDNYFGELGSATNNNNDNPNSTPALVSLPGATGPVVQAAAGYDHSLAVTSSGQLYAFGENNEGELGSATNSGTSNPNSTPALVSLPGATGPVVRASAGDDFSLAVTSSGQLYAFGYNFYGELGSATNNGTNNPNPTPALVSVAGGASIDTVALGSEADHTLAVVAELAVSTGSLPGGTVGSPYTAAAQAAGGTGPYAWSASGLPPGLQVDRSSGQITGTPTSAGSFTPTLTVTDHDGIVAGRSLSLTISPVTTSPVTTNPVKLAGLRVTPHKFSLAGRMVKGGCVKPTNKNKGNKRCRRPIKLRVSYTLSATATVTFTLKRGAAGRKANGSCVKPTKHNSKHKKCERLVGVRGKITRASTTGANHFTFNGKLAGHTLVPGTYRLAASSTGGSGQTTEFTLNP